MKSPKWVVFDFSGTLYYFHDNPIKEMWELAKNLKSAGYKLAICTNISLEDRKNLPKFDIFEEIIDFEIHGTKKPDPRLYQCVEKKLKSSGDEVFYIDDTTTYTKEASKLGWQVFTFGDPSGLNENYKNSSVDEIRKILLT